MASVTLPQSCFKCLKAVGQVLCGGCQQWFCVKHLFEHRQELNQRIDNLTHEHDQLRQNLIEHDRDRHDALIVHVDRWESKSIEKIKQIANEVRLKVRTSLDELEKSTEDSLTEIAREIQENRQMESYTEIDLAKWMNQLEELKKKLKKPEIIEIVHNEDKASVTHLPLIQLQIIKQNRVPSNISNQTKWPMNGRTVAGGHGQGHRLNQLNSPFGLDIDHSGTLFIADTKNHRIMRWEPNSTVGKIIIGYKGQGNRIDQLDRPVTVLINRMNDRLIISDWGNQRIIRWSFDQHTQNYVEGTLIISNITCFGLVLDNEGFLYASDYEKHEVRRYGPGDGRKGVIVAGGNGQGSALNQLDSPRNIFVDGEHSIFVSERDNHRVMKWPRNAREGIVVAGGRGEGKSLDQLFRPSGIMVDRVGTVYVADQWNHRVMRWLKGAQQGEVILGEGGQGSGNNQLSLPASISFDSQGNLYVADRANHRIQRFEFR